MIVYEGPKKTLGTRVIPDLHHTKLGLIDWLNAEE
jgi:hypothetical protein